MSDPRRLLDPRSDAPVARSLLEAGLDVGPPPGAKERVWGALSSSLGAAAIGGVASAIVSHAASSAPAAAGVASSVPVAGVAGASVPAASVPAASVPAAAPLSGVAASAGSSAGALPAAGAKAGMFKLVAGKWILLSVLSLAVVGVLALRGASGSSSPPSVVATNRPADGATAPANGASTSASRPSQRVEEAVRGDDVVVASNAGSSAVASPPSPDASSPPSPARTAGLTEVPREVAPATRGAPSPAAVAASTAVAVAEGATPADRDEAAPRKGSRIAEESAALADARAKLQSGDAHGALAALAAMDREFGVGALSQERAALEIRALAESGQRDRAAREADAFLASYPESPLAARVKPFASNGP